MAGRINYGAPSAYGEAKPLPYPHEPTGRGGGALTGTPPAAKRESGATQPYIDATIHELWNLNRDQRVTREAFEDAAQRAIDDLRAVREANAHLTPELDRAIIGISEEADRIAALREIPKPSAGDVEDDPGDIAELPTYALPVTAAAKSGPAGDIPPALQKLQARTGALMEGRSSTNPPPPGYRWVTIMNNKVLVPER